MTDIRELKLHDLQPSQFYISEKKLHDIREWFDPQNLSGFEPIPVKILEGVPVMTDGHTRDNRGQEIIEKARKYVISGLFLYPNPFDSFSRILEKNRSDLVVNTGATTP